jgi:hypothetical protein
MDICSCDTDESLVQRRIHIEPVDVASQPCEGRHIKNVARPYWAVIHRDSDWRLGLLHHHMLVTKSEDL